MILSVSRRTDILRYYSKWFINRLEEGFVLIKNPFNSKQVSKVELNPNIIDFIVFWTKDAENFIKYIPVIKKLGYKNYFKINYLKMEKLLLVLNYFF